MTCSLNYFFLDGDSRESRPRVLHLVHLLRMRIAVPWYHLLLRRCVLVLSSTIVLFAFSRSLGS